MKKKITCYGLTLLAEISSFRLLSLLRFFLLADLLLVTVRLLFLLRLVYHLRDYLHHVSEHDKTRLDYEVYEADLRFLHQSRLSVTERGTRQTELFLSVTLQSHE